MGGDFTCEDCGLAITEDQYADGDGFCPDCARFHGIGLGDLDEPET